ncbi:hypothetical protein KXS11_08915 [Plantibacter flavus]|uniref:hypothetical protein n=1 Tax=Plantibacter flavus TaxID=150123 RepID=UPI003F18F1A4
MREAERARAVVVSPQHISAGVVRTHWFLKSLRDSAQVILVGATSVLVTVGSMQTIAEASAWPGLLWWIGAGLAGGVLVIGRFTFLKPTYAQLSRQLASAEQDISLYRQSLQGAIDELASQLCEHVAGDERADTRVSVYSVENDEFVLQARVSRNPELEKRGRRSYPLHKGHIGRAWQSGSSLASFNSGSRAEWEAELVAESQFTAAEARLLSMFSRSILAKRLDSGREKIGLIVFESERASDFDVRSLQKLGRSRLLAALTDVVKASHSHLPRAQERRAERTGSAQRSSPAPVWINARSGSPTPTDQ